MSPGLRTFLSYYNDIDKNIVSSNRVRWNLAHELGHVILNHHEMAGLEKLYRVGLDDETYQYLEDEADYFAQLILVPHSPLLGFNIKSSNHIKLLCKISGPASRKRYYEFSEWKRCRDVNDKFDRRIFQYYFDFIFKRKCQNCNAGLIQRYGRYCPICGKKNKLQWGDGDKMKYPLLETYENGKIKECPICHNEETNTEGGFCHICGTYIINECPDENCPYSNPLPSNARFCPICGQRSRFYANHILKAWNYNPNDGFMNIPDGIDDEFQRFDMELPFN